MPCCTTESRCEAARALAQQYHDERRQVNAPAYRATAQAYTVHLRQAGVISAVATSIPSDPRTWDILPQAAA